MEIASYSLDAGGGDGTFGVTEVARQVIRLESLSVGAEVEQRPEKALDRVLVDLDGVLNLPLVVVKAYKDEVVFRRSRRRRACFLLCCF